MICTLVLCLARTTPSVVLRSPSWQIYDKPMQYVQLRDSRRQPRRLDLSQQPRAERSQPTWLPCRIPVTSTATPKSTLLGYFICQLFPLTCAWALTCHRFQGQTVDHLCMHAHQSSPYRANIVNKLYYYVALSRVRTLLCLSRQTSWPSIVRGERAPYGTTLLLTVACAHSCDMHSCAMSCPDNSICCAQVPLVANIRQACAIRATPRLATSAAASGLVSTTTS